MKNIKKICFFICSIVLLSVTIEHAHAIDRYCKQFHTIATMACDDFHCTFFKKDFSYESIVHANVFFSLFYDMCTQQQGIDSDEIKIIVPFRDIVTFVDSQSVQLHEMLEKNSFLLHQFGQFICVIYCKILFELSRSFLYDIAFFYIQFSTIPLNDLFDIINILYQRISLILTEGGVSDMPTFLCWLKKRWFIPIFATAFIAISFLRWKGRKKQNTAKAFQIL